MVWSIKFIKYRENKLIITTYVQNVRLWLKHKLASVLAIGRLYRQSETAPCCTTQLRDVHGLPLPVRISFPVLIRKFPNQSLWSNPMRPRTREMVVTCDRWITGESSFLRSTVLSDCCKEYLTVTACKTSVLLLQIKYWTIGISITF